MRSGDLWRACASGHTVGIEGRDARKGGEGGGEGGEVERERQRRGEGAEPVKKRPQNRQPEGEGREKVSEPRSAAVSELVQRCIKRLTMHLGILVKLCRMRADAGLVFVYRRPEMLLLTR
ncbi:hypothetical protein QLX08_010350 [Tetragonisca angustula]|uniref:Uncharacterized protein n=1 Tax=Tetragonisca angustula TaxID=166442 RepID=A0AAW0ZDB9_9HYME